jgi:hypothetical protein
MYRKPRGYIRDIPIQLQRDYRLFAIACEGEKREVQYFKLFEQISDRIKIDIIEEVVSDEEMISKHKQKSAPKWVLDRALKYIETKGLAEEDFLWFIMDIDRWEENQLREIANLCDEHPNWNIALSNPCFEVWLYFHKKSDIQKSKSLSCKDFKNEIASFNKGGYHPYRYIIDINTAIINSKSADTNPIHFMPGLKETKVYNLGEALLSKIGKSDFQSFIEKVIPDLINKEQKRVRLLRRNNK